MGNWREDGACLIGSESSFPVPSGASEGDCLKNRVAEDCLLVHSIFVTVLFSEGKPNKTSVPSKSSHHPKSCDSSHSYPEAAPGLCNSYFPSLSHNTRPKQLEEGNVYFGSDFKSEPITTRKGRYGTGACSGWPHCIPRQKAEENGTMDHGIGLPIVKGDLLSSINQIRRWLLR